MGRFPFRRFFGKQPIKKRGIKRFLIGDTIATCIVRYEKYRCWASKVVVGRFSGLGLLQVVSNWCFSPGRALFSRCKAAELLPHNAIEHSRVQT